MLANPERDEVHSVRSSFKFHPLLEKRCSTAEDNPSQHNLWLRNGFLAEFITFGVLEYYTKTPEVIYPTVFLYFSI